MTRKGIKTPNLNNGLVLSADDVRRVERWREKNACVPPGRLDKPTKEEKDERK